MTRTPAQASADLTSIAADVATFTQAPPPPPAWQPRFPGDVKPGFVRWGAAIGGNTDPVARHEAAVGRAMGVRRTYWAWSQRTTSMTLTAKADLAVGRVPWVSIKPPAPPTGYTSAWQAIADGRFDADLDATLRGLDVLGGPVYFTLHHEPEGGGGVPAGQSDDPGGPAAWRAMQIKVRQRMAALATRNIAFAPVLMSWTFSPASGRNPADWWAPNVWDFAGIDHYVDSEAHAGPGTPTDGLWAAVTKFYAQRGLPIALGEWGNRGTNAVAAAEMARFYEQCVASGSTAGTPQVIALAYFDSDLNSPTGGWSLQGEALTEFRRRMVDPRSVLAGATW